MNIRRCSNPLNIKGIEEWMSQFFTDPFTSLLDEETFRIDLFETNEEYIIEAQVGEDVCIEHVMVYTNQERVIINLSLEESESKIREIRLPICIHNKKITANLTNGILEVIISKTHLKTEEKIIIHQE
ncbi:Hsp20/alpha crystallin family protein [Bacillus weihaiensis]|uniref:Hsp20/alpha crystallin family protein n=1 Tax=Bacillus weihaiensis TaxID=1547283 RepID=UPI002355AA5E|nr:Hsp20/alpha crystallin family protein [Bacillus weihaiensis]